MSLKLELVIFSSNIGYLKNIIDILKRNQRRKEKNAVARERALPVNIPTSWDFSLKHSQRTEKDWTFAQEDFSPKPPKAECPLNGAHYQKSDLKLTFNLNSNFLFIIRALWALRPWELAWETFVPCGRKKCDGWTVETFNRTPFQIFTSNYILLWRVPNGWMSIFLSYTANAWQACHQRMQCHWRMK